MKAIVMRAYGGPDVLEVTDLPDPELRPGEVLIRILASGMNRLDHYLREGSVRQDLALPHVLGSDAVGEIVKLAPGVEEFAIGDRVVPMPGYPVDPQDHFEPVSAAPSYAIRGIIEHGTYAQFMRVPARWVVRDQTGLSPHMVATLPMALVTTIRALRNVARLQVGETIVIHAGASGTGIIAVQVAKAMGAQVIATVRSPNKRQAVAAAGADSVVIGDAGWVEEVRELTRGAGADVVLDNLGGQFLVESLSALRPLGRLVSMGMVTGLEAILPIRQLFFAQQQILGTLMGDKEDLEWGLRLVADGKIKPFVDTVYPFARAAEAHARLASAAQVGTLVFDPWA